MVVLVEGLPERCRRPATRLGVTPDAGSGKRFLWRLHRAGLRPLEYRRRLLSKSTTQRGPTGHDHRSWNGANCLDNWAVSTPRGRNPVDRLASGEGAGARAHLEE